MWRILLAEFLGDLEAQRLRAFLTMGAITWGTLAVVLLLSFGEGLKRVAIRGTENAGDRMFMVYGNETAKIFQGLPKGRQIQLTEEDLDLIRRSIADIDLGSPSYGRWGVKLEHGERKTTTYMEGVTTDFALLRRMAPQPGGRFLNTQDVALKRRVIFLGDSLAVHLFGKEAAAGRTLVLDGLPFTVVGVMEPKMQMGMSNGPDADRAIIPASTFRTIYGNRHVNQLLVRPRSLAVAPAVKKRLYEVLGRRYQFDPADERALSFWDFVEELRDTRRMMVTIEVFLGLVGCFTLLVAGIGVANIMYVVARERTREIGIKLAVGARRRHILAQFLFESMLLCLTGGSIGLALAAGAVALVRQVPKSNMALEFLTNPTLSWPIGLLTIGILTAIGLLAGVLPARRSAALDPAESLRYE
jgi:putative ABC transport system permease protein